ncbi:hypothetical protein MRX96_049431 [Rhipicephalus microplus]
MESATVRPGLAQQPGTSAADFPQDATKTAPKQTYKSTQLTLSENSEALPELDNDVRESTFYSLDDTSYANSKTPQSPPICKAASRKRLGHVIHGQCRRGEATPPPASEGIDGPLPALGGLQLGNAAVAAANKFKEVTLYKPPVFTRCSMWTPGTEVVPRAEASGDLNIVKNYFHAPQEPLPRRDIVSREMAMVSCVLVSVLLVLAAACMNIVLGHTAAKASRTGTPDSLSTTSESGDDSVVLWQPEKPQSQLGVTNGSRDDAVIENTTTP